MGLPEYPGLPLPFSLASRCTWFPNAYCSVVKASRHVRASHWSSFRPPGAPGFHRHAAVSCGPPEMSGLPRLVSSSRVQIQPTVHAVVDVWASQNVRTSPLSPLRPPGAPGFHLHAAVSCGPPELSGLPSPVTSPEFRIISQFMQSFACGPPGVSGPPTSVFCGLRVRQVYKCMQFCVKNLPVCPNLPLLFL